MDFRDCKPFAARGASLELFRARASEVLFQGPAGTGKTRTCLEKAALFGQVYPGSRILLLRQTRASMSHSVLQILETDVLTENSQWRSGGASRSQRSEYVHPNGSEIVVAAFKNTGGSTAARLMSTRFDLVIVSEATEVDEHDYELVASRINRPNPNKRAPYNQIIAECNPAQEAHWLNKRANAGRMLRIKATHQDNPLLHDGRDWTKAGVRYLASLKASLSGARLKRLLDGEWATNSGAVYAMFEPSKHVIADFKPTKDHKIVRAIDFGFHTSVCQWLAADKTSVFVYRELVCRDKTADQFAAAIKAHSPADEKISTTVADHDPDKRAVLARLGVPTALADKSVEVGIDEVMRRFSSGTLFIVKDCVRGDKPADKTPHGLIEEIDSYEWESGQVGKPKKKNDHSVDTLRYGVMHLRQGAKLYVASPSSAPYDVD